MWAPAETLMPALRAQDDERGADGRLGVAAAGVAQAEDRDALRVPFVDQHDALVLRLIHEGQDELATAFMILVTSLVAAAALAPPQGSA